jgi:arylsulfatase
MGYATGQFGKNHLGAKTVLPTVHGFDEFFGYLYHLDAMEDPAHPAYHRSYLNTVGPCNVVPRGRRGRRRGSRWGKVGKQRIEDAGTLYPKRMEAVNDEIRDLALKFIDKAKADNKPFFLWLNRPACTSSRTCREVRRCATPRTAGPSMRPAWRNDDDIGIVMQAQDMGVDDNTIVIPPPTTAPRSSPGRTADRRHSREQGHVFDGFRVPAMIRWPGKVPAGKVENGIISGLDWFPTFVAAAGSEHRRRAEEGQTDQRHQLRIIWTAITRWT